MFLLILLSVGMILSVVFSVMAWQKVRSHHHHYTDVRGMEVKLATAKPAPHRHRWEDIENAPTVLEQLDEKEEKEQPKEPKDG